MKPTVILRHRKERLNKCSLRGLENREDFHFVSYPEGKLPLLDDYILLKVGAPPLTVEDRNKGLFLLDGTWHLAKKMENSLSQKFIERSLPMSFKTAYPRCQTACPDPKSGLASIEAIYAAYSILERPLQGLLDGYYWKDQFLALNRKFLP